VEGGQEMSVLNSLQSISVIVASVVGSGTVIYGINAWRREYAGKRKLELAEEVLALFYEARDAIRFIRNPFGYVGEGSSREAAANESPEEKRINDQANVVFERYSQRKELFNKINSMRYRYMAQFGKDSAKPFDNLNGIISDIFGAAQMLAYYWKRQGSRQWKNEEERQQHLEEMHKSEAVFWQMTPAKDEITPRLEAVISEIEAQSAKIIGKSK
jgi:hypothetical protein